MDRIDAMKIFVTAVDEGSLAGAARRLRRSPTAISRAIVSLEAHVDKYRPEAFPVGSGVLLSWKAAEATVIAGR